MVDTTLGSLTLSGSESFPTERYGSVKPPGGDDNSSIFDYSSIANGIKSFQSAMGWNDSRNPENEREQMSYIEGGREDASLISEVVPISTYTSGSMSETFDFAIDTLRDSQSSYTRRQQLASNSRSSVMKASEKQGKGANNKKNVNDLKGQGKQLRGRSREARGVDGVSVGRSLSMESNGPPVLDRFSRSRSRSLESRGVDRYARGRSKSLESREGPDSSPPRKKKNAAPRVSKPPKAPTSVTSSKPPAPKKKEPLRQRKSSDFERADSQVASTVLSETSEPSPRRRRAASQGDKPRRSQEKKSVRSDASRGVRSFWSMSIGGRSRQQPKKRMSGRENKKPSNGKKLSNETKLANPQVNSKGARHQDSLDEPHSATRKINKKSAQNQNHKPNRSIASGSTIQTMKSKGSACQSASQQSSASSWIGTITDTIESWSKREPKLSMAAYEDTRLGDLNVPPTRVRTTRRLEIAEESTVVESRGRAASFDSDSLTNSVSFQLTTTSEIASVASDRWTQGAADAQRSLEGTSSRAWTEIVKSAEIIAHHYQVALLDANNSARLREEKKFRDALHIFRLHAHRLKMSDRELFAAIREDPSVLNDYSTFDDDDTLDALGDLWEGFGNSGLDRYVEAVERILRCGAVRDDPYDVGSQSRSGSRMRRLTAE